MKKTSWFILIWGLLCLTPCWAKNPAEVWNLDALKEVPAAQWGEPQEKEGIVTQKVWYAGEPYRGKATRVFAFVSRPQGEGPFPGIVLVHGGGGTAFSFWAEKWAKAGYAAIAMDLAGCEIMENESTEGKDTRRRMEDGGPGQSDNEKFGDFNDQNYQEIWTYHAIANILKAHSLLDSLPCVDPNRTAATGISWGGYLTTMAAGIDDRFQVVVPVYGCGNLERNSIWTSRIQQMPWPQMVRWNDYFDPIRYVGNAKCRMFFVNGTDDFAYPLDIHRSCFDKVPHADVRLQIHMPHSHGSGWNPTEIQGYVDSILRDGKPLPCLEKLQVRREEDGSFRVTAQAKYGVHPVSARLHYTTDTGGYSEGKWQIRQWKTLPATCEKEILTATIPAEIARQYPLRIFMDATDADGRIASTHYQLCPVEKTPAFTTVPEGGILLLGTDAQGNFVNRFLDKHGKKTDWKQEGDTLVSTQAADKATNPTNTNHIHSDVDFRDAHIHAEFLLPPQGPGNSGLYIHGNYETQIFNSNGTMDLYKDMAGALYNFYPPLANAVLPPGEWQSYDIDYTAPRRDESGKIVLPGRITAFLNGVLVLDNVSFEEPVSQWHPFRYGTTDYLRGKWEHQKKTGFGPLFLQDHGDPVHFRNVWIQPVSP